jgi:hypothetical protein
VHFGDLFYARGRFTVSSPSLFPGAQVSDLYLYAGWTGYREPHTGVKISGDLMLTLPTSAPSQSRSTIFNVGPGLVLSRTVGLLAGLTFAYRARATLHVNHLTSPCFYGNCATSPAATVLDANLDAPYDLDSSNGAVLFDVTQGASVSFRPHQTVSLNAECLFSHGWLYPGESAQEMANYPTQTDVSQVLLSIAWHLIPTLTVGLSAFVIGTPVDDDHTFQPKLYHSITAYFLDVTLNFDHLMQQLQPLRPHADQLAPVSGLLGAP